MVPRTRDLLPAGLHRPRAVQVIPNVIHLRPARSHGAILFEVVPFAARLEPACLVVARSRSCIIPNVIDLHPASLARSERSLRVKAIELAIDLLPTRFHIAILRIKVIALRTFDLPARCHGAIFVEEVSLITDLLPARKELSIFTDVIPGRPILLPSRRNGAIAADVDLLAIHFDKAIGERRGGAFRTWLAEVILRSTSCLLPTRKLVGQAIAISPSARHFVVLLDNDRLIALRVYLHAT